MLLQSKMFARLIDEKCFNMFLRAGEVCRDFCRARHNFPVPQGLFSIFKFYSLMGPKSSIFLCFFCLSDFIIHRLSIFLLTDIVY